MKLKKIMALALSGVLAVSMLAGCSGSDKKDDEKYANVTTSDIGADIVAAMKAGSGAPARLTSSADSKLEDILTIAIGEYGKPVVLGLTDTELVASISTGSISLIVTKLFDAVGLASTGSEKPFTVTFSKGIPTAAGSKTGMVLYSIGNGAADEDIAKLIAEEITGLSDASDDGTLNYSYDIRAAVSGIVVPGTDYGTKYIAVMITCTAEAA